jgi:hypothetical protein
MWASHTQGEWGCPIFICIESFLHFHPHGKWFPSHWANESWGWYLVLTRRLLTKRRSKIIWLVNHDLRANQSIKILLWEGYGVSTFCSLWIHIQPNVGWVYETAPKPNPGIRAGLRVHNCNFQRKLNTWFWYIVMHIKFCPKRLKL